MAYLYSGKKKISEHNTGLMRNSTFWCTCAHTYLWGIFAFID